jgi:hypothetical protein
VIASTQPAAPVAAGRGRGTVPRPVTAALGLSWALAVGAPATGRAGALGHDLLLAGGRVP